MPSKTTTVLLVAHGSRKESANNAIQQFHALFQTYAPIYRVQLCFLEFSYPRLDEALNQAAKESTKVVIVPLMLGAGGHVTRDIPCYVEAARRCYLDVVFTISQHLGAEHEVLQALLQQIKQLASAINLGIPTAAVLIARGSSNRMANSELAKMARWISESCDCAMVDIAFSGLTTPSLETVVQAQLYAGMQRIIIIPYYLFTGVLIDRIALQMKQFSCTYPTTVFDVTDAIGLSDFILALLHRRIVECLKLENR